MNPYDPAMASLVGAKRPPLQSMVWLAKVYGQVSGMGHRGKAMVWLMADRTAVVVQNAPNEPDSVTRTVYPIDRVQVRPPGVAIHIASDPDHLPADDQPLVIDVVEAPCVCGAGPAAVAIPQPLEAGHKIDLRAATEMPEWVIR